MKIIPVEKPASSHLHQSSAHLSKDVAVEWWALKSDWSSDRNPSLSRYCLKISLSKTLLCLTTKTGANKNSPTSHTFLSLKTSVT